MKKMLLFFFAAFAITAAVAGATAPKEEFASVSYHRSGGDWADNPGTGCASSGALCDITFDAAFDLAHGDDIKVWILTQNLSSNPATVQYPIPSTNPQQFVQVAVRYKP